MQTTGNASLRDAFAQINNRIAQAAAKSGRRREDILMVAVTKTASPDQIRALAEMGQTDFAENRVQHLTQRVAGLDEFLARKRTLAKANEKVGDSSPDQVRWHMIGHLQRNKVKAVVPLVKLIHSVDSLRLCEELQNYGARTETEIDVLLQVNSSGEPSKFGVAPPAAIHLAEQIDTMMYLNLRGIMTMAPYSDNPEDSRGAFARTADIFNDIKSSSFVDHRFKILSMGMTNDFEVAIEEGANLIRIGRALFGDAQPEE